MSKRSSSSFFETEISHVEMRTTLRYPILQRCFVHLADAPAPQPWQCVAYSVSASGIGIGLPIELREGTLLTIHAWDLPRARPLQVRIVYTKQIQFLWFTGCELLKRLSDADLQIWRSGPLDWVDKYQQ